MRRKVNFSRSSGILLHPTSLAGRFGIGDLGAEAYRFVDFLHAAGQTLWQVLPLGPTGYGDSPYQCFSAFAGNPLLISPQKLVDEELVSKAALDTDPDPGGDRVDFGRAIAFKKTVLAQAYDRFSRNSGAGITAGFDRFLQQEAWWLEDYALFQAIKDSNKGAAWNAWEPALMKRESEALGRSREELREQIEAQKFTQYLFFEQWFALKSYCNQKGIRIVGDVPIFVAYDSADVWARPELFKLNDAGQPVVVAGVPPDYFSKTGQLWGNPIYDWERMRADGFQWWVQRMRAALQLVDIVRVDHFRGFAACWEVPAQDKTAERGRWVEVPGRDILTVLESSLGQLPILAEDLGVITPDVEALRDEFGLPGMRILQFAFADTVNNHLPHNHVRNAVVYTGTHDNDTCVGWFNSVAGAGSTRDVAQVNRERDYCLEYLNADGREIHWEFIRAAMASVASMAIVPAQDVLGLDSNARMNLPASTTGNWNWRLRNEELTGEHSDRLLELARIYVRGDVSRAVSGGQ
jgi:4-alpha-glucanotransferase